MKFIIFLSIVVFIFGETNMVSARPEKKNTAIESEFAASKRLDLQSKQKRSLGDDEDQAFEKRVKPNGYGLDPDSSNYYYNIP